MTKLRVLSAIAPAALVAIAVAVLVQRGGVLGWVALVAGLLLLAKMLFRPGSRDVWLGIGAVAAWSLVWLGCWQYVVRTWESGEVVELVINVDRQPHIARIWVLDMDGQQVMVYDAERDVADALAAGQPVRMRRGTTEQTVVMHARSMAEVPEAQVTRIFVLMDQKYGSRNFATEVFYTMLGGPRSRVIMILSTDGQR